ncbi:contact-dependent growth inhibition system immunity protein [Acetobacter senegalensis]|uniref:contact-dependent growth inhibition system immunity protein n=1 Tax=Acetobacter senegalensis TaxID=446692 RepID=UPI00209CC1D7|nr:contact-dependent growth inhibition system immunity protein [Acetobacter senegalensis]MCP1197728.1 contact-dependent growth inhibition system immunity protein [Acetobacter senegalensis]
MAAIRSKRCSIRRTDKWISIESEEVWYGTYFSRKGHVIHAPRDVTPEWIGLNVRLALQTSESFTPVDGSSVDGEALIAMKDASNERRLAFWDDITASYGYKNRELAWKKFDLVFASWWFDLTNEIMLKSSKSSRDGGHSAWPRNRNEGRVFSVPIDASDRDLGEAVLKAFSKCEGPGKSTEPLFP